MRHRHDVPRSAGREHNRGAAPVCDAGERGLLVDLAQKSLEITLALRCLSATLQAFFHQCTRHGLTDERRPFGPQGVAVESRTVDALVVTGFLYRQTALSFEGFPTLVSAGTDPAFKNTLVPADYLTTAPGSRSFFYAANNIDPATARADERTKATTTNTEVPGFAGELFSGTFAGQITVPVLNVVGDSDFLYKGDDPNAYQSDQKSCKAPVRRTW